MEPMAYLRNPMGGAVIKGYLPLCLMILIGLGACVNQARVQEQAGTHIRIRAPLTLHRVSTTGR